MTSRGTSYGACAIGTGTYDVPRETGVRLTEESAAAEELVHYHVDDQVAAITFDSQHNRNALSKQLVGELFERLDRAEADDDGQGGADPGGGPHVLLRRGPLRGQRRGHGEGRGGPGRPPAPDRHPAQAGRDPRARQRPGRRHRDRRRLRHRGQRDDATYAFTEVRLGLTPAAISLTVLPRMTDRSAALTFLTGEVFDGREAERTGLVTKAVPEAELDAEVDEICGALAKGNPQGLRETKALLGRPLVERIDAQAATSRSSRRGCSGPRRPRTRCWPSSPEEGLTPAPAQGVGSGCRRRARHCARRRGR